MKRTANMRAIKTVREKFQPGGLFTQSLLDEILEICMIKEVIGDIHHFMRSLKLNTDH
jgi:hypothetical protein